MSEVPEYWINLKRVTKSGADVILEASEAEKLSLSKYLPVEKTQSLSIDLQVRQWAGKGISVQGAITADFLQTCVVTLEPIETRVNEGFTRYLIPATQAADYRPDIVDGEMVLDAQEDDFPDVIEEDAANAWDIIIEELNLILDPYPKSVDAQHNTSEPDQSLEKEPIHKPFAELSDLLNEKKSRN